jgi:hypothetical protein
MRFLLEAAIPYPQTDSRFLDLWFLLNSGHGDWGFVGADFVPSSPLRFLSMGGVLSPFTGVEASSFKVGL